MSQVNVIRKRLISGAYGRYRGAMWYHQNDLKTIRRERQARGPGACAELEIARCRSLLALAILVQRGVGG
jgi:hypothetical protein